jgi:hypothetical protein
MNGSRDLALLVWTRLVPRGGRLRTIKDALIQGQDKFMRRN